MARDSNAQFPAGGPNAGGTPPEQHAATGSIRRDGAGSGGSGDDSRDVSPFNIGDILGGRYKIKRFLGRGGMGEVFEVEDQVLHTQVALKTIHPREADRAGAIERFKREINVARRVTHPNVCRLFDVGSHRSVDGSGKERETLFLTMELLGGENLSDRINAGRMTPAEAFPILQGMAQGLGAAHRAGVLHRDFKAANVMIAVSSESGRSRAVVTDFGLARTIEREEGLASLSDSGVVVGTPAYMSPEQVRGEALTPASDIYALGLVLFEMVTGTRPFAGGSAWSIAVRRLTEAPPQPRSLVQDLDPRWDAAIQACLQIDPSMRPKTPEDVVEMVGYAEAGDETHALRSSPRGSRRPPSPKRDGKPRLVAAMAVAGALVAAVWLIAKRPAVTGPATSGSPAAKPAARVSLRPSLVVLGAMGTDPDQDLDWVHVAASEILARQLANGGRLRVLPPQEAQRAVRETEPASGPLSPSQILRIRVLAGTDFAVTSSATPLGSGDDRLIRLELRLLDLASGRSLATGQATGPAAALHEMVEGASEPLRKVLKVEPVSPEAARQMRAAWPADATVSRHSALGTMRLRQSEFPAARVAFEKATQAAPQELVPRAGLAAALLGLGNAALARKEAETALGVDLRAGARTSSVDERAASGGQSGFQGRRPNLHIPPRTGSGQHRLWAASRRGPNARRR